ncbi:MAG: hypothetical protein ACI4G0_02640 [Ruminococcus sp.]
MGSLTEKYQQLRNGTEEKQRIEQEMQKLEAYYGDIIARTKFLDNKFEIDHSDHGISFERYDKYKNTYNYSRTLLPKLDPQRQALLQEAAKLVREDKWTSWKVPGKNDVTILDRRSYHVGTGDMDIYYRLEPYIKTKWADGSIHACGHKKLFEGKCSILEGPLDGFRKIRAQNDAYREMMEYSSLILDAAAGDTRFVRLSHSFVLFIDGTAFYMGDYLEKATINELEDYVAKALDRVNA